MASQGRWGTAMPQAEVALTAHWIQALHCSTQQPFSAEVSFEPRVDWEFLLQLSDLDAVPISRRWQPSVWDFSNLSASSFKRSYSQKALPWHSSILPPSTAARPASKPPTSRCYSPVRHHCALLLAQYPVQILWYKSPDSPVSKNSTKAKDWVENRSWASHKDGCLRKEFDSLNVSCFKIISQVLLEIIPSLKFLI